MSVFREVKIAYSDNNFRASQSVSRDAAIEILQDLNIRINDFNPKVLKFLPEDCRITIAREGSVCLYVTGMELPRKRILRDKLQMKLKADEMDRRGDEIRLWWD
jgi:hypothetical protein